MSEEEKIKKREYEKNRYHNMSEENEIKKESMKEIDTHNDKSMLIITVVGNGATWPTPLKTQEKKSLVIILYIDTHLVVLL